MTSHSDPTSITALVAMARLQYQEWDAPMYVDELCDAIEALQGEVARRKDGAETARVFREMLESAERDVDELRVDLAHYKAGVEAYRRFRKAVGVGLTEGAQEK